jgi:ATP-dependent helicase/nuclease subunit A
MLDSKVVLFSTNQQVRPQDFMILLRQRNEFASKIVKELKNLQLPVSGLDKIDLFEDLSVMDLLSAAKFTISMEDELNLSCLLKSPIFGFSEERLFNLLHNREENLYSKICSDELYVETKNRLADIIKLAHSSTIRDFFYILVFVYGVLFLRGHDDDFLQLDHTC